MRIGKIVLKGFRSLLDVTIDIDSLTAIVGRNGAGKSSALHALRLFYDPKALVTLEDFYNEDQSEISIQLVFTDLPTEAQDAWGPYIRNDQLVVERVFTMAGARSAASFHGYLPTNPAFEELRRAFEVKDRAATAKTKYKELGESGYDELPEWTNKSDAERAIRGWELTHSSECHLERDDGTYFNVASDSDGDLTHFSRLIYVPAVRDATDMAREGRASVFSELLELVVRSVVAAKEEVVALKGEMEEKYQKVLAPERHPELTALEADLTKHVQVFVPSSTVELTWFPVQELPLPMPTAEVRLTEDGFSASVERCGHGLQRAFVVALLQQLVEARSHSGTNGGATGEVAHLMLVIEEPELFQHPNRQRHFSRILRELSEASTPGVVRTNQVLYATHSPLFVGIEFIDQVRLMRKVRGGSDLPMVSVAVSADLQAVATELWAATGQYGPAFTAETLKPRLRGLMTPWVNEGFFADVAVLVEGEDDRAALTGVAQHLGHDFEALGIAIIPCRGKPSLDRPTAVFRQLGIPTYTVWDSDQGRADSPTHNQRLLRLFDMPVEDWPSFVSEHAACFDPDLETVLKKELGAEFFDTTLDEIRDEWQLGKRHQALKVPDVIREIVGRGTADGHRSETLEAIVKHIIDLGQNNVA